MSAAARTRPASVSGSGPPAESGRYCVVDGSRNGLRKAREARVLRADVALEVGELAHELGSLVGLGEAGCLAGGLPAPERLDERFEPSDLVPKDPAPATNVIRAELLRQSLDALRDVALEGEGRVLEPPLEHGLVAPR